MKIKYLDFRQLDRKWLILDKWKDIKKLSKVFKYDFEDAPLLIYSFIDHNNGITIKIVGNVYREIDKSLSINNELIDKDFTTHDDYISNFKIVFLEKDISSKILNLNKIEDSIELKYYNKDSYNITRDDKRFDEFRNECFPDDLELFLETNKKGELLWGRIKIYSKEKDILVCELLEDSKNNKDYKKESFVMVKVVTNKKSIDLVIDALANVNK